MLTPSTAWYEACTRADADLRFLVAITDGVTTWKSVDGSMLASSDLAGTEGGVQDVTPVGAEVDPLRRRMQMSELFVNFDDAYLRPILVANRLEKQTVTVKLGAASLSEADFVAFFTGPIDTITPVSGDEPKVVVTVLNAIGLLEATSITGWWVGKHPLEVLYTGDGAGVLEKGGLTSFNAAAFDPSDAAYDDIAHLMVSRVVDFIQGSDREEVGGGIFANTYAEDMGWGMDTGINEAVPAINVVNSISELIGGSLVIDEAGQASFVRFDPSVAAVDTWTEDDIIPGSLVQEPLGQNIVNRIYAEFGDQPNAREHSTGQTYVVDDSDSQTVHGVLEHKIVTNWITLSPGWLTATMVIGAVPFTLQGGNLHAMSGNRADAWAQVSAALPLYLMFWDWRAPHPVEILKAESLTRDASIEINLYVWDAAAGVETTIPFSGCRVVIDDVTRGVLGTNANDYGNIYPYIYDITSIVLQTDALLARFKYGSDVFSVDTPLTKYSTQLGDLILPDLDNYLAYDKDGLDGTEKYEIISKEIDVYADPPVIHWRLMSTATFAPTRTVVIRAPGGGAGVTIAAAEAIARNTLKQQIVTDGLVVSDGGNLDIDISAGHATDGEHMSTQPGVGGHTLPASSDVYVKLDKRTNLVLFDPVANEAAAPTQHPFEELFSVVVTGAAAIDSIDNTVRHLQPIQGSKVVDRTITSTQLGLQAVETANIKLLAVDTPQLQAGAATAPKVGPHAIGVYHLLGEDAPAAINRNSHFQQYSLGTGFPPDGYVVGNGVWDTDVEYDNTQSYTGNASVKFLNTTPANDPYLASGYHPCAVGDVFHLGTWVRASATGGGEWLAYGLIYYTAAKAYDSTGAQSSVVAAINTWEYRETTFTVPAGVAYFRVFVQKQKTAFFAWFDSCEVTQVISEDKLGDQSVVDAKVALNADIKGSKLLEGTGPLTHLSVVGALDNLTSITTKDFDDIDDTATFRKVAGVSVAGQIQPDSIQAAAVGIHQSVGFDIRTSINLNSHLLQYTRG